MREYKQSTANNMMIFLTDTADHITGKTGLTLTCTLSKDGGAFASVTPTVTDRGNGWYNLALTTSHTDTLGDLAFHITATGADPADPLCRVVANVEADTYGIVANLSTETQLVDAVWDELLSGHATAGSAGKALTDAAAGGSDPWATALPGAYGAGTAGNIVGNRLDVAVSTRLATAGYTAPLDAAGTRSALGLAAANLDTQLAGIQGDTDNIQTRLPAALVGGRMDASVGAMVAGTLTAAALATDAVTELVYGVWDEVLTAANHNVTASAGKRLRSINGDFVHGGTAVGGTINTIVLDGLASSTDGTYDPGLVRITGGTGAGQARLIIQYTGATRTAAVDRDWRPAPDTTSTFEILSFPNVVSSNEGLAQGGGAQSITLNVDASTLDNIYNGQTIALRTGTGQDQSRLITTYNGSTKVATVGVPWAVPPVAGTGYLVIPTGRVSVSEMMPNVLNAAALAADAVAEIADGVWDEALSGHLAAGSTGAALSAAGGPTTLTSSGLDAVVIEAGLNARQAISLVTAALAGVLAGAATTNVTVAAAGAPTTNRISAVVTASGDRTSVTLAPPA